MAKEGLILPGANGLLAEKPEEAGNDLDRFREMFFIGAIMGAAEEADKYLAEANPFLELKSTDGMTEELSGEFIVEFLAYCVRHKWNVAQAALNYIHKLREENVNAADKQKPA